MQCLNKTFILIKVLFINLHISLINNIYLNIIIIYMLSVEDLFFINLYLIKTFIITLEIVCNSHYVIKL